ncbi:MAG: winged helix-turn-helix transcriptional regulator [Spirochaetaceae bacterium]|nr:winged helix-turn-helix transcriptional regulator [Spirochaetaceae bacterium]
MDGATDKPRKQGRELGRKLGRKLALIRKNNKITTHELAEVLSLTVKGVEWQLKQLKDKKVIIRVGADKGGYWEIVQGVDK